MKELIKRIIVVSILIIVSSCSNNDLPDAAESTYLDYKTKTELELPFNDEWWVFWGGRSVGENYHAALREQRFALDIVQKINGSTHTGNGSKNEDYYCFGKSLNAPGSGKIVDVVNNIKDNIPGQFNQNFPTGNRVVIDHENGEFSILTHFKKASIIVLVGDRVIKGQELGKAGNSGNSSEPHLHYHLQNTADPFNGEGLPAQFQNYYANQIFVEIGEPIRDEHIINRNGGENIFGIWNSISFLANEPLFDINGDGINSLELLDELPCRYSKLILNEDFSFLQRNNSWSYNELANDYECTSESDITPVIGNWKVNSDFSLLSLTIGDNIAFLPIEFDGETLKFNSSEPFIDKNAKGESQKVYGKAVFKRGEF